MSVYDRLRVSEFLASPRHGSHFRRNAGDQRKIWDRVQELRDSGKVAGKRPIINFQVDPDIVELHDGNASVVAWLIYAREQQIEPTLGNLLKSFDHVVLLHNRRASDGVVWHPYVPAEVRCAGELQEVDVDDKGHKARKALTHDGVPVYFNDERFSNGEDAAEALGTITDELVKRRP